MKYLPLLGIVYVILPIIDGQEHLSFLQLMTTDPRRSVEKFYSYDATGAVFRDDALGIPGRDVSRR
jgi:hypothetical protein